jgi:hypothetical protein
MAQKISSVAKESVNSQATYIDRRDERIAYYYFVRRVTKPPAIYDFLLRECRECLGPDVGSAHAATTLDHGFAPLVSENRESGLRIVQSVVMRIRKEAKPEEVLALRRPVETAKVKKTYEYLLQKAIDVIEDNSYVEVEKVSPSGEIVTIREPRCSKQDKAKAFKAAADLNAKIGRLTGAELEAVADGESDGAGDREPKPAERFAFNFPNVQGTPTSLDDMIAMNMRPEKLN